MTLSWAKTSRKEVFKYIEKYRSFQSDQGIKDSIPTGSMVATVFDISASRANQYLNAYKEANKNIKNLRFN